MNKTKNIRLNHLVVVSRAGWIKKEAIVHFQDNDGFYIDGISTSFKKVTVITKEFKRFDGFSPNYGYRFTRNHIDLLDGMEPISHRNPLKNSLSFFKAVLCLLKADVVYCFINTIRGCIYLLIAKMFLKKTIAYNGTNWEAALKFEGISKPMLTFRLTLENLSMKFADIRIVTGPLLKNKFSKFSQTIMASPLSTIINKRKNYKRTKNYNKKIQFLCISHFRRSKNLNVLIETCAILRNHDITFHFNIVGDGPIRPELELLTRELNLENHITFHGYVNDPYRIADFYISNDIFLFASSVEGFPRSIWEAIHFELYVICSKIGGIEQIFNDSQMSILEKLSPYEFAKVIESIYSNPELRFNATDSAKNQLIELFPYDPFEQFQLCINSFAKDR